MSITYQIPVDFPFTYQEWQKLYPYFCKGFLTPVRENIIHTHSRDFKTRIVELLTFDNDPLNFIEYWEKKKLITISFRN